MAKIPHFKYLQVLIAHRLSHGEVQKELEKALLPPIGVKEYKALWDDMYKTAAEYYDDPESNALPDEQWLRDLDIIELYAYKYDFPLFTSQERNYINTIMPGTIEILNDPLMRRAIQALSIAGNVPVEDIELIINGKYDITYISDNFSMFLKYFFDIHNWTLAQKRDYVKNLHVSQNIFKAIYMIALKHDKSFLLWKLGLAPDKSFDQMLRDIGNDCYYNFKEKQATDPDTALKWGTLMNKVIERLDKVEKDTEDKTTLFQSITFQLNQEEGYNKIINEKERKKRKIDVPKVDMGESPDIITLEKLGQDN